MNKKLKTKIIYFYLKRKKETTKEREINYNIFFAGISLFVKFILQIPTCSLFNFP